MEDVKNEDPLFLNSALERGSGHILEHLMLRLRNDELAVRDLDVRRQFKARICWVGAGPNATSCDNSEKYNGIEDLGMAVSIVVNREEEKLLTSLKECRHTQSPFFKPAARSPATSCRMSVRAWRELIELLSFEASIYIYRPIRLINKIWNKDSSQEIPVCLGHRSHRQTSTTTWEVCFSTNVYADRDIKENLQVLMGYVDIFVWLED